MVAKLWYLKQIDLLGTLDEESIETLGELTTMDEVDADQPIYFPGERSDMVYILKKGRVKISRQTTGGRKITLALLEPGEIFGELSLTDEEKHDTTAETVEKSLVCALSKQRFREFLENHPELAFEVTKNIGDRRREIESKVENLMFKDAESRLAYILKDLFENHGSSEDGLIEDSEVSFSHQEIADLSGLTRPTTTNLLNQFAENDFINLGRRSISLKDPGALTRQARED